MREMESDVKTKVAVLIPCYNEAATIAKVVADYRAALPDADIYVYDNNSSDGTDAIAEGAGAIVRYERKQGKGNVIRTMFREIDADCYLMIDGDDTYPAEDARAMVAKVLEEGADMVVGDRLSGAYFTENKRPFHNTGNVTVKKLVNRLFHGNVDDIMTGYRAFSPLFVKTFPVLSEGFEIETEMTIHALDKNMNLATVAVGYRDRPEGSESKLNTVSDGIKVLKTILLLYKNYKPMRFFSLLAVICFIVALAIFIPQMVGFAQIGEVPHGMTLIAAGFIFVVGLLLLICGFILDTVTQGRRQDFEVRMNMLELLLKR
ncbi:MAG: glycosyltransferase family 2 protein [Clostridiales Family XIII bacterium]|jgi:glycosyltransferase involved in cell wall biosynthesis|nr:glycosyltransferase family 2 protein [Clostridiales Family XIII bacterium]